MASNGKYVRIAECPASDEEKEHSPPTNPASTYNQDIECGVNNNGGDDDGSDDESSDDESVDDGNSDEADTNSSVDSTASSPYSSGSPSGSSSPEVAHRKYAKAGTSKRESNTARITRMEQMLESITHALGRSQENTGPQRNDGADESWGFSNDVSASGNGSSSSSIRVDYKPFPSGIPASKMWEEWSRYIENFEIAASLNNVNDPAKRNQLLFFSMGDDLQGIVKAAKLRPSLTDPNCYTTFVKNIQDHLYSMTDVAAEHEAFLRMRQASGESAVAFHARLMRKVRSCKYKDEDRFVRSQLLSGLRNRELVKQARTYGYDTNFIVQSATRDEAFDFETKQQEEPTAFEVQSTHRSPTTSKDRNTHRSPAAFEVRSAHRQPPMNHQNKRRYSSASREPPRKQYRRDETNQRSESNDSKLESRCQRCSLFWHRNGRCPAFGRTCDKCGKRGHFAAACPKQVNFVQNRRSGDPDFKDEFRYGDNKQV